MGKKKSGGKLPKGRAGAKQKAQRGSSSAAWTSNFVRSAAFGRHMLADDEDNEAYGYDDTHKLFQGFAQLNNNNSPHPPPRDPSFRLRHQAITFVSAGSNTPTADTEIIDTSKLYQHAVRVTAAEEDSEGSDQSEEEEDSDGESTNNTLRTNIITAHAEQEIVRAGILSGGEIEEQGLRTDTELEESKPSVRAASPEALPFVIDTMGDPNLGAGYSAAGKKASRREPSPAPSDSSEEVVLFHGRGPIVINDPVQSTSATTARSRTNNISTSSATDQPLHANTMTALARLAQSKATSIPPRNNTTSRPQAAPGWPEQMEGSPPKGWLGSAPKWDAEYNPDAIWAPAPVGSWWKGQPRSKPKSLPATTKSLTNAPNSEKNTAFAPLLKIDGGAGSNSGRENSEHALLATPAASSTANIASTSTTTESREVQLVVTRENGSGAEETIASLQADWKAITREKERSSPKSRRRGKRGRKRDNRQLREPVTSGDEDEDADGEAAYDDYMANLAAQLDSNESSGDGVVDSAFIAATHSASISGPSLVVDGREVADDEVIEEDAEDDDEEELPYHIALNNSDDSSTSSEPIGQDLSELSDTDSSELEERLEYTEREQWEDEADLRRRRQERMTDEQIARIFAKQEELGIHGDEMVLEDGDYGELSDEIEGIGDIKAARAALVNISNFTTGGRPSNRYGVRRRGKRGDFNFPDASALADTVEQYGENGFDIMDFDRPSLRNTKKGRSGKLPPELEALSDEELKTNMVDAWENDRSKKRLRKAEREELRAQGLLGAAGKKGKADLSQKYPFGMTSKQIKEEVARFLQDDGQQSRAFPPMDKKERKELHEFAIALGLHSKSIGKGKSRFPVLYKTGKTKPYNALMFEKTVRASDRGHLDTERKYGAKFGKHISTPKGSKASGGGTAAATVRNGEIVGAGAAEIGKESFGHKMMEKMGWSKGMALGKEGEGRLQPVEQVMRAGRSGLG